MANRLYNKQVSPKGYKRGGGVSESSKKQELASRPKKRETAKKFLKTVSSLGIPVVGGTMAGKKIAEKIRAKKMGGGMMKRPMMKEGGKLKMVMKGGKKVPFFAADGKGAKDLGKAAMKKGGLAKLNPGLKAFMKKKMAKKK